MDVKHLAHCLSHNRNATNGADYYEDSNGDVQREKGLNSPNLLCFLQIFKSLAEMAETTCWLFYYAQSNSKSCRRLPEALLGQCYSED